MRVFERIGRMVRADAHGMMDQLEERSLVLRQHLREAEIEVASKRARLEALDDERRRLTEEGQRLEARVAALDADVEIALAGDDPALARYAVRRLLPQKTALRELFARAAELDASRARLVTRLETQEVQLEELRPRVRIALARPRAEFFAPEVEDVVTDDEVDLELLRRRAASRGSADRSGSTPAGEGA